RQQRPSRERTQAGREQEERQRAGRQPAQKKSEPALPVDIARLPEDQTKHQCESQSRARQRPPTHEEQARLDFFASDWLPLAPTEALCFSDQRGGARAGFVGPVTLSR